MINNLVGECGQTENEIALQNLDRVLSLLIFFGIVFLRQNPLVLKKNILKNLN